MDKNNDKIRVLYICGSDFSGAEMSLLDMVLSVKEEVEPIVLVPNNGKTFNIFTEKNINCICHRYTDAWIPSGYLKNVAIHPWRLQTIKFLRYDITGVRYVIKAIQGGHLDIIHTNYALTAFGAFLARKLGLPHVWHIREYLDKPYINGTIVGGRNWLRKKINNASARIVVSAPCRDFWKLKQENTYTINDAVLNVKESCYVQGKQPYILYCSSFLCEAKGVFVAVSAYGKSGLSMQCIRLKVVGNASDDVREKIKAIAAEYQCADMLDFIQAQEDVKPLFANAMAYINPSMKEGMGRTTAEAMFYGCPVVACASGGTLDLIRHGETGWLFDTEEECAELLKKVCTTDQNQVILRAQEFAKQNLSIENYGSKILEVYQKVLKN